MTAATTLGEALATAAMRNPRRYVITGGPSSGKDDLVEAILAAGIPCMEAEPGREIYRKRRERLGRHLRREDRHEYSLEVLQAFIGEYTAHKHGVRFYNRGIPDGYGWDAFFGLGPTPQLEEASRLYRYDVVFVLDPLDTLEDPDDIVWAKDREFVVGTQINRAPHLGTNLVQTAAFLLAKIARREFSIDTTVRFSALDNAPYDVVLDPETHHAYQQTYLHALGKDKIAELIDTYYLAFFTSLSAATDTDYAVETYTEQQATPGFRAEFLRSLERLEDVRWWMAPSHGVVHVRLPCPQCGWAEKRGDRTKLAHLAEDGAVFTAVCLDHGLYQAHVDPEDDQPYLDLATLYRNLVKERALGRDTYALHVMMKGGDWAFGCQLVDGALGALATPASQMPIRIFTPQVLAPTGAKLSKSLLREHGKDVLPADVEPWMLDTTAWPGSIDDYVDALVWLVSELLTDPKHFFRSFTVKELGRLTNSRPADLATRPRAHEMGIYKRYLDLIATGRKTTEIRVNDSSRRKIKEGSLIRFKCRDEEVLTRVTRVARYSSFEEMFDHESVASVNPTATREDQLRNIRQIYPPDREALGVVAIRIELLTSPSSVP